jgi:hypothetical protein
MIFAVLQGVSSFNHSKKIGVVNFYPSQTKITAEVSSIPGYVPDSPFADSLFTKVTLKRLPCKSCAGEKKTWKR